MAKKFFIIKGDINAAQALHMALEKTSSDIPANPWLQQLLRGLVHLKNGVIDGVFADILPVEKASLNHSIDGEHTSISVVSSNPPSNRQRYIAPNPTHVAQARAEITLNSINDAVVGTDVVGNVDYLNPAAERMTGWSKREACGRAATEVIPLLSETHLCDLHPIEWVLQMNQALALGGGPIMRRRDGSEVAIEDSTAPIYDSSGGIAGAVMVFRDISATQAMTAKIAHLAHHDFLTNLPNRVLLNDRVSQAVAFAQRRGTTFAVLFLDLDNFKHINDSLGHAIGDRLLQSVADRLRFCVRGSDTVSRQGGDEFVVLLAEKKHADDARLTAKKIIAELAEPHLIEDHQLHVTTSIGISVYPHDGEDAETLVKNADMAMYQAKERGRNNYQFFKSAMNTKAVERQTIEANLRVALEHDQFILHYQPKVNLATGMITGVEALLRWSHPEWGEIRPDRFISIAEDCGLIGRIGKWVLREACLQSKRWSDAGLPCTPIAINISALEFSRRDFVATVRSVLHETDADPGCLELEITESILMRDAKSSATKLHELKMMGVSLAVDDFGTGYSSLSYLNKFPIDVLKIDQSFIHGINFSADNNGIIEAIIAMGASLHQRVVAEGVEHSSQLDFLKEKRCEEGQGYLFSPPITAPLLEQLLASGLSSLNGTV